MISHFRWNSRLLLTLVAAWSILLGASQALHAVTHQALPGPAAASSDHSCTLCSLERTPVLPTVGAADDVPAPKPELLPLLDVFAEGTALALSSRHAILPCAGRAPPHSSVS